MTGVILKTVVKPETSDLLKRMAAASGSSLSGIIAEMLDGQVPHLKKLVPIYERAMEARKRAETIRDAELMRDALQFAEQRMLSDLREMTQTVSAVADFVEDQAKEKANT